MKSFYTILMSCLLYFSVANAQVFNNIVNYNFNSTPVNGVKIKTNLPFTSSSQMPTITIQGYDFGAKSPISLTIVYYIYGTPTPAFTNYGVSSFGNYTPQITLANESGKVVIFINDLSYFMRFTVSAYAQGLPGETAANFTGWTVADEALTGTSQVVLTYTNQFAGNVAMPAGVWNSSGNVGIGTASPGTNKLAVAGTIHAQKIAVDLTGWSDNVFDSSYALSSLKKVQTYIAANHHLSEIPSEKEVLARGIDLGDMNRLLLKKVEDLTLYLLEADKKINQQQRQINDLAKKVNAFDKP
jgi:hypothetical protein